MNKTHEALVEKARRLAEEMDPTFAETLAGAVERSGDAPWASGRAGVLEALHHPHYRALASEFLDACGSATPVVSPQAAAMALHAAAASERAYRERQSVELVWTGPDTRVVPLRLTEQVVLQVIESARERLTVVSYAVYEIPRVCEALVRAAARGVKLRVVIEAWDRQAGRLAYDRFRGFGDAVASRANVYLWPLERRTIDAAGRPGVLHVKCLVADGRVLFLSSANLTENAFSLNMELGVLVRGGSVPAQADRHFEKLIEAGVLGEP